MDLYFLERLRRLACPVRTATGVQLKLVVGDHWTDYAMMDYDTVFFHRRMRWLSDDELTCVLLHEWGHRLLSPKTPAMNRRIRQELTERHGFSPPMAEGISAIAFDLIVDRHFADHTQWGSLYRQGTADIFHWILNIYLAGHREADAPINKADVELLQICLRMSNVHTGDLPSALHGYQEISDQLLGVLLQGTPDFMQDEVHMERVIAFCRALYRWLPESCRSDRTFPFIAFVEYLNGVCGEGVGSYRPGDGSFPSSRGIPADPNSTSQDESHESLDLRLVRQVIDFLDQHQRSSRCLPAVWQPHHPLHQIDLKRSLRCHPELIPGLTTRRQISGSRPGKRPGKESSILCLIVDDSGSMEGAPARFAVSLAEGITRHALQWGIPLGLISFGSQVVDAILPGSRHHTISQRLRRLTGRQGGTRLVAPLEHLSDWMDHNVEVDTVWIFTDAELKVDKGLSKLIGNLLLQSRLTFVMINTEVPASFEELFYQYRGRIRFLQIDPSQPVDQSLLKEIFP